MSAATILKSVKLAFPELKELSRPKLRVVEKDILYATRLLPHEEVLSSDEHSEFLKSITPGGKLTTGLRLKAYRLREDLTQVELSKKCQIPQANISAMENGSRTIGLHTAKKLAQILKCDYRVLI